MHPVLIKIFGIPVYSFGFFVALGFLVATFSAVEIGKKYKINSNDILDLTTWILIAGIVGARLLYIVVEFDYYMANPKELLMLHHGGLVYYGGLIGAVFALIYFFKSKPYSPVLMGDIIAASIPIGQMFGRIGCFLNGCCFGTPSLCSIRVTYPMNSIPFIHYKEFQPIHPVQLYESLGSGIIFLILVTITENKKFNGQIIALYGVLYGILRFSLEFFRGDVEIYWYSLSMSQYISIAIFLSSILIYGMFAKKNVITQ